MSIERNTDEIKESLTVPLVVETALVVPLRHTEEFNDIRILLCRRAEVSGVCQNGESLRQHRTRSERKSVEVPKVRLELGAAFA